MIIPVAVGVIINSLNEVLMTQRALSLHQGGLWEFPGGKVEPNESIHDALVRELKEELNIHVQTTQPFISIEHHYPEKSVRLHVYLITQYTSNPKISDGQLDLKWISLHTWNNIAFPVPTSNLEIIKHIRHLLSNTG